jgi:hypothetical protein
MAHQHFALISYIAPGAPATRRPATGDEPFLRPEIGFTPLWYRTALGIDFGERWHTDPAYRRETVVAMRAELARRFPGTRIGGIDRSGPLDLLTGAFGACSVAAIFGIPILYAADNWPNCAHRYLGDEAMEALAPPDLDRNAFFQDLMRQMDWIAAREGCVEGFLNWQGVLNNAYRLRGEQLLYDMVDAPNGARHLFDCVATTMLAAARRLHARQRETGVRVEFFTVSNCLVNMVSPAQYRDLLLPFDRRIAEAYGCIGIHNCAWTADPYVEHYAAVPHLAYIDMGQGSDLPRARATFPHARRAIMYTPMDLANKPLEAIRLDLKRIARDYAPCDLVLADIEAGTPDERVIQVLAMCEDLSSPW